MFGLPTDMLLVVATVLVVSVNGNTIRAKPPLRKVIDTGVFSANELLCDAPLGLSTGFIGDSQLSASSSYDSNHDIRNIRLTTTQRPVAAWCAGRNDVHQHVQVDFGKVTRVTGVATQGRGDYPNWVTAYKIMYSNDKRVWKYYRENNEDKEFSANAEQFSVVRNNFAQAVSTRYIRIKPVSWHSHISMRAEFFGCHKACESPLGMTTGAIATSGLESSSSYDDQYHQKFSRLNSINLGPNSLAWCAAQNDQNQFLQIDIGYVTTVTAVATQVFNTAKTAICGTTTKFMETLRPSPEILTMMELLETISRTVLYQQDTFALGLEQCMATQA
ncbi:EGF-like repeat and discoidin I-like domain-containing protein 3 isoform X2 [Oscarella lobularis]|uniref:EGF-like repeat and discoidin I-like domain-containing protein 3 isoform X2 n=1 Tax=Oscarella lobularis TaxID=121494 RepID=UPI0033141B7D